MTVQAPLGEQASRWRQRLTGPVLLADRGSEDAAVARRAAADIAARTGIPLRIVTAWAVPAVARVTPTSSNLNVPGVYEDSARAAQQDIRAHLAPGSVVGAGYVAEGNAPAIVAQTAAMIDASLVVIGSRAGRGLGGRLMGLLPEALVRAVRRPVLMVRGQTADWPPTSIIIVDGDSSLDRVVAAEGATLGRILAVPAALVGVTPTVRRADVGARSDPALESFRNEARRRAARLEAECGAEVSSWVTTGEAIEVMLGLASDPRVLVVAGRQLQHHGLGKVVSALLHGASGPVLIVPELSP
jgi:nucleotide-binding universal stress UspA family protein